jgi:hypothetical protein
MRNLNNLILVGCATVAIGLTGCQSSNRSTDRSAGRALDDRMITGEIQKKLREEPVYKFSEVDVKTFAGVVQLSGFVTTDEQKRRAGEVAQHIDGVSRVVNNITLKPAGNLTPTGRSDSGVRTDDANRVNGTNNVNRAND